MKYRVKNWKELLKANNKSKEDFFNYLESSNENLSHEEANIELVCEMIEDDDPAIKYITSEKISKNVFEITEIRRDGR